MGLVNGARVSGGGSEAKESQIEQLRSSEIRFAALQVLSKGLRRVKVVLVWDHFGLSNHTKKSESLFMAT